MGTSVKSGDANDDGVTDVLDFNIWNSQRSTTLATDDAADLEIDFDVSSGALSLLDTNTDDSPLIRSLVVTGAEPSRIPQQDDMETAYVHGSQQWWFEDGLTAAELASVAYFDSFSQQPPFRRVEIGYADGSTQIISVPETGGGAALLAFLGGG